MIYKTYYSSPIGKLLLASDGESLTGLWIEGQKHYLYKINEQLVTNDNLEIFKEVKNWLDKYFKGEKVNINNLKLNPSGTKFQNEVWQVLCSIPYGEIITYKETAEKVAINLNKERMSAQAVGRAIGHNPISIIIPCHRVIGSDGNLTGYAGGIDKKIKLLQIEENDINKFYFKN